MEIAAPYNNLHTRYHKIHARSRTEARWAVFFDGIRLHYRYEHEDTHLAALNKRYLPDIYLSSVIGNIAAEIKGKKPTDLEQEKCYQLCYQEGYPVLLINGSPYFGDYNIEMFYTEYDMLQCKVCEKTMWPTDVRCDRCGNNNPHLVGYHWGSKVVRTQDIEFQQHTIGDKHLVCAGNLPLTWSHLGNALQFAFRLASHAKFEFMDNWQPSLYDGDCVAINPAFQTQDWSESELLHNCFEGFFDLETTNHFISIGLGIVPYKNNYEYVYYLLHCGDASNITWNFNQVLIFIGHAVDILDERQKTEDIIFWERIFNEIRYLRDSLPLFFEDENEVRHYTLRFVAYLFTVVFAVRTSDILCAAFQVI